MIIALAGDVMIGRLVNEQIKRSNPKYVWGNVLPILKSSDVKIINLEAALTRSTEIVPKTFNFKSDPEHVSVLSEVEIDAVNLANNHVLDYGITGLWDTLKMLNYTGIKHVGAGADASEAANPALISKKGLRLALFGFTDNEPGWKAGLDSPGINHIKVGDIDPVRKSIQKISGEVDIIIVSLHWGPNMRQRPTDKFIHFAHQIIDCGADIIHGHSAHIFQGIEWYQEKLILYDTGDFIDDYRVDPVLHNDRSFLFLCDVDKSGIQNLKLVPVTIFNMQVNLSRIADFNWSIARMQSLSEQFGTEILENGEVIKPKNYS